MRYFLITLAVSFAWVGLDVAVFYFLRGARNDLLDYRLGQVGGFGFIAIWGIALWYRFSRRNQNPRTQPTLAPSRAPTERRVHFGRVIRDVILVWVLTAVGGFLAGIAARGSQLDAREFKLALLFSNLLFGTIAFTIIGCLAPPGRWRHLGIVALGTWITNLINVLFFGVTIPQWTAGSILIILVMGNGGAVSYILKRSE